MNYLVTIKEAFGFITNKTFTEEHLSELLALKEEAHKRAVQCLPWSKYEKELTHLVYYYEIKRDENTIEVDIEMNPVGVNDKLFYDFVETWTPEFVGAIHRH